MSHLYKRASAMSALKDNIVNVMKLLSEWHSVTFCNTRIIVFVSEA